MCADYFCRFICTNDEARLPASFLGSSQEPAHPKFLNWKGSPCHADALALDSSDVRRNGMGGARVQPSHHPQGPSRPPSLL